MIGAIASYQLECRSLIMWLVVACAICSDCFTRTYLVTMRLRNKAMNPIRAIMKSIEPQVIADQGKRINSSQVMPRAKPDTLINVSAYLIHVRM